MAQGSSKPVAVPPRPKYVPAQLEPNSAPVLRGYTGLHGSPVASSSRSEGQPGPSSAGPESGSGGGGREKEDEDETAWLSLVETPAYFPLEVWIDMMQGLVLHPERNSTSILRAEVLEDTDLGQEGAQSKASERRVGERLGEQRYVPTRLIRRRILPRRPNLDWPIDQDCTFYERCNALEQANGHVEDADKEEDGEHGEAAGVGGVRDALLVYLPRMCAPDEDSIASPLTSSVQLGQLPERTEQIPFYHPRVRALAFRFIGKPASALVASKDDGGRGDASALGGTPRVFGTLRIDIIPFPDLLPSLSSELSQSPYSLPPTHRLQRTALALLQTQHAFGWGRFHSYVARVRHDVIVPREPYQDLYLALKARRAPSLIAGWKESTDPKKHVFEDIGIAAWLMLLWKEEYKGEARIEAADSLNKKGDAPEWHQWPRPPGGFVDVGCGNGLLVHILNAEGYDGYGFDLRARHSWDMYKSSGSGANLRVASLDAPDLVLSSLSGNAAPASTNPPLPASSACDSTSDPAAAEAAAGLTLRAFPPGAFLIGNHADELTPWLPLLAAATPGARFANIPCCAWQLDGRFTRMKWIIPEYELEELLGVRPSETLQHEEREPNQDPDQAQNQGRPNGSTDNEADTALLRDTLSELARGPPGEGGTQALSRNAAYLTFISHLHLQAGWHVEKEALRIPSTKNWALVGRRRTWEHPVPSIHAVHAEQPGKSQAPKRAAHLENEKGKEMAESKRGARGDEEWTRGVREQVEMRVRRMAEHAAPGWTARTPEGNVGKTSH